MRGQRRMVAGIAVVAAALVSAGLSVARESAARRAEISCKPGWFVPSLSFKIVQQFVQPQIGYASLWRKGVCRIDPKLPFSYRLSVVGTDGVTIDVQRGGFSGDMNPGGSSGGGATIRLGKWCAHQPVRVNLTGAGPNYAATGRGYHLLLGPLTLRCR